MVHTTAATQSHRLLQSSSFGGGMAVVFDSPLGRALHDLPKTISTRGVHQRGHELYLKRANGAEGGFGTALEPDVAALLSAAVPSPFGRGEETVFDESVRRGKELTAETISVLSPSLHFFRSIKTTIRQCLFPRAKSVSLRFYKLALYEAGGHFDFHRDTTHAPNHHATLLVEVKSVHKGGALVFEIDGEQVPGIDFSVSDEQRIEWIAFYTDVRHKVEPVTEGVRIVLQYDVLVEQEASASEQEDEKKGEGEYEEEPYLAYNVPAGANTLTNEAQLTRILSLLEDAFGEMEREASTTKSEAEKKKSKWYRHERYTPPKTLALPLFYFYRTESVLPEFLKSIDRELFFALLETGAYEIALVPIVLGTESDDNYYDAEVMFPKENYYAYLSDPVAKVYTGQDEDGHVMEEGVDRKHVFNTQVAQYIVSKREPRFQLFHMPYVEQMGNEPAPEKYKYFLSAMLVNKKPQVTAV